MSITTKEFINQTEESVDAAQSDISYFIDKALTCCENNDIKGAKQALKRLKLMEDSLLSYRLSRRNI